MGDVDAEDVPQACPRCQQTDFNYEDLDEGTKLVCTDCGFVLDEVVLVHQRGFDDDGLVQTGVHVGETDDGHLAGGLGPRGLGRRGSGNHRHQVAAANKERLDGALSFLQLPQHVATAARHLLSHAVEAYGAAERVMQVSPATVAAVLYLAARQEGRALSLGAAAAALDAQGPAVFRECRRVREVLGMAAAPPSLEAAVMLGAARLLEHYGAGGCGSSGGSSGPLRRQPLVVKALQLTQLLVGVGAVEGRSPWVGAAAVWAIVLAEHFKDASSRTYARQVAGHLQHTTQAVQQHINVYEEQLSSLLALLPYARIQGAEVGVQVARHAGTLLKLQSLSLMTKSTCLEVAQ